MTSNITRAVCGVPNTLPRGTKSEVAHIGRSGYITPAD